VGGGPAGLSAALQLGRSLRDVLVCDNDEPRNGPAAEAHGYLTRDGIAPDGFRRLAREEVTAYSTVEYRNTTVADVAKDEEWFRSTLEDGETHSSRKVLFATGVVDVFPDIEGFEELWGNGIYHCPYCHGYEVRDQPLGVHVDFAEKIEYAKLVYNLSEDLVVFTDDHDVFDEETHAEFTERGIRIEDEPIVAFNRSGGGLESISLADDRDVPRHALFYGPRLKQGSSLIERFDVSVSEFELVETERTDSPMGGAGRTSIAGLFVAGDASNGSSLAVPTAAAEGYDVGATVNAELAAELF